MAGRWFVVMKLKVNSSARYTRPMTDHPLGIEPGVALADLGDLSARLPSRLIVFHRSSHSGTRFAVGRRCRRLASIGHSWRSDSTHGGRALNDPCDSMVVVQCNANIGLLLLRERIELVVVTLAHWDGEAHTPLPMAPMRSNIASMRNGGSGLRLLVEIEFAEKDRGDNIVPASRWATSYPRQLPDDD